MIRTGGGPVLPGVGSGEIYTESATGIFRIELATGQVTRTSTPDLEEHVTFLAGRGWVLVKSRWSPTGVLVRDGQPAAPLPHQFDPEGLLHAGPEDQLWVQPEPTTDPRPTPTLHLARLDGLLVKRSVTAPRSAAPYTLVPDGYGNVLLANHYGVYRLDSDRPGRASRVRLVSRGDLIAAGGRRLLVWDCRIRTRCTMVLVDQQTHHRTSRPAAAAALRKKNGAGLDPNAYGDAQLSPDGTHLAVTAADPASWTKTHVIDLRTGSDTLLPGVGTDVNANRQLAWTPNSRWLFALDDQQVHGYDTRTHLTRNLPLGGEQMLHLTNLHAAGW